MSWPEARVLRPLLAFACAAMVLAGCTIAPLHQSDAITTAPLPLSYADPASRLEQVFYNTLAARLGRGAADAPQITARISVAASDIGLSSRPSPVTEKQVIATVSYRVEQDGTLLASGTRTASAAYRTTGQIVADDAARARADEDAVRTAAQAIMAALLADPALQ